MAGDGKIYITISDKRFGQNVAEADEQNKLDKQKEKKDSTLSKFAMHQFFNFVESQAKQAVSYTVNNVGNFTGDYIAQAHVSDAMTALGWAGQIATATVAGAKVGGPVGAAIGAVIGIVAPLITKGYEAYTMTLRIDKQNRDIAQLKTRAGLNSTNNWNRGTEY